MKERNWRCRQFEEISIVCDSSFIECSEFNTSLSDSFRFNISNTLNENHEHSKEYDQFPIHLYRFDVKGMCRWIFRSIHHGGHCSLDKNGYELFGFVAVVYSPNDFVENCISDSKFENLRYEINKIKTHILKLEKDIVDGNQILKIGPDKLTIVIADVEKFILEGKVSCSNVIHSKPYSTVI
jgi:hypothetical protein